MPQLIEIENGIARLIERSIISEVDADQLHEAITTHAPLTTPLLPAGTVAMYVDHDHNYIELLVERAPRKEYIKFGSIELEEWFSDDMPEPLELPVPWEYYFTRAQIQPNIIAGEAYVGINEILLYWRPTRLQDLENDLLWPAKVPNVDSHGLICFGGMSSVNSSLSDKVNDLINNFYASEFNTDMGLNLPGSLTTLQNVATDVLGAPQYNLFSDPTDAVTWTRIRQAASASERLTAIPSLAAVQTQPSRWTGPTIRRWAQDLPPAYRALITEAIQTVEAL